jgi:hypothetical protein
MRYSFIPPARWSRSPFPPPQRGVYLRAPVATPSAESASILLFEALAPVGTLEDHLAAMVKETCAGLKVGKSGKPEPKKTRSFRALAQSLSLQVPATPKPRDELRVLVLVEADDERLPVAFIGASKSLPVHQAALDDLIASIGRLEERWEIAERRESLTPGAATGNWADNRSAFDLPSLAGPGFLDPGSHALANHTAPMMAAEAMQFGALTGASMELGTAPQVTPEPGFGGGGGGDGGDDGGNKDKSDKSLF